MSARRLPLAHVLVTAAGTLLRERRALLRVLLLPVLLQFAAGQVLDLAGPAQETDAAGEIGEIGEAVEDARGDVVEGEAAPTADRVQPNASIVALALLLIALAHVMLLVGVLRLVLLGPAAVTGTLLPSIGLREVRVLGWFGAQVFAFGFLFSVLGALAALGLPGYLLITAAAAWLLGRFAMIFPGLAVDRPTGFARAWRLGDGAGPELAMIAAGVPFLGGLVLLPLLLSDFRVVHYLAGALGIGVTCWSFAAVGLAWRHLDAGGEAAPDDAPRLSLEADAALGVLRVALRVPVPETLVRDSDPCPDYRGRLRGLLVEVHDAPEDGAADLVEVVTMLPALAVHRDALRRVAFVSDPALASAADRLHERLAAERLATEPLEAERLEAERLEAEPPEAVEARWFPTTGHARALAWSAGEDSAS